MRKSLSLAIAVAACALAACSQPAAATCSRNSDCPRDAICVSGICQKGVPSGGSAALPAGATRLTAGTLTMDATIGQPVTPAGSAGTRVMVPAENTR